MFQPSMSIEITTNGFFAEPVLWHTSTLLPAADDEVVVGACCVWTDAWVELEWLTLPCVELECECFTFECPFAFPCADAVTPVDDFECLVCPGALADFPCTACCAACFFTWPGAFPELPGAEPGDGPWPFPATALPLNAIAATATAITPQRTFLGRCIASPDVVDKSLEGRLSVPQVLRGWMPL